MPTLGRPTKAMAAGDRSASAAIGGVPATGGDLGRFEQALVGTVLSLDGALVGAVRPGPDPVQPDLERLEPAGRHLAGPQVRLALPLLARDLVVGFGWQGPHDRIEEVAGPTAVGRRDRVGVVPAEGVELGALELATLVVGLVHRHEDRRGRSPEELRGVDIGRREPRDGVDDEDDDVRLVDGEASLLLDLGLDRVARLVLEPAGIDDDEPPPVPLGVAVEAVAGRPGAVLDDRRPRPEDPVEQRALADVRAADDGDDGEGGHRSAYAAPEARWAAVGAVGLGSEVVRPAGVAAAASAAIASSSARAATSAVPPSSRTRRATSRRSSIGRTRSAGHADDPSALEDRRVVEIANAFDLDGRRPDDPAEAGQLLRVGAAPAADDDHEVDAPGRLEGVLLAADRDGADRVDDLQLVAARDHERRRASRTSTAAGCSG